MRAQIFKYWDRVRSSFWFIPAVMAAGAVAVAFISVTLDETVKDWSVLGLNWIFSGDAEGATAILGTVAGSMITITGVVFSMTLVALSLTSSQLGPRLLHNFMSDTTTQMVLGTFVSTFLYCLLILRTVRRAEEAAFTPHLSVSLAVLFTVISVAVLIYFIHHVSVSIQANEIMARVGTELNDGIERLFPARIGSGGPRISAKQPSADFLDAFDQAARPVCSTEDGYLQFIDGEGLIELAEKADVVIRLARRPGHYIVADCPLAMVWSENRLSDTIKDRINIAFALGSQRTPGQDIEFSVNQLVEIAVRALSPGVNDPFTAISCVDHLGSALCRLAQRELPSPYRHDRQDQLRLIAPVVTFAEIADAAFNQIRQYGRSSAAVTIRMLETIAVIAEFAHRPAERAALLRHAEMIARGARDGLPEVEDRGAVEEAYQAACQACRKPARPGP
ncbi:MAG: DUF2254 domain-containing protein [Thiobacillus sp.]